jgi:hypothetical protein
VTSVNTAVGTISFSPLVFNGGDSSNSTQFMAGSSGSTSLTAGVPAGFSTPAASANTVTATVRPSGIVASDVTVGKNLETLVGIQLQGATKSPVLVTITSNSPSLLLFSQTAGSPGSAQATQTILPRASGTAFFAQGLASSGTATYTVSGPGYGTATGTVTLAPSGIFIFNQSGGGLAVHGPNGVGLVSFETASIFRNSVYIAVATLDSGGNIADATQYLAGGLSVNVKVANSNPAVGKLSPLTVTIPGGFQGASTTFQPLAAGTTTITVDTPAGFSTPARFTAVPVGVLY